EGIAGSAESVVHRQVLGLLSLPRRLRNARTIRVAGVAPWMVLCSGPEERFPAVSMSSWVRFAIPPRRATFGAATGRASMTMRGWLRSDGRKGIRNTIVVAYLVECARHAAESIARPFEDDDVHVIGFPGCYRNQYAYDMMVRLCTHPNVGAVLFCSLG